MTNMISMIKTPFKALCINDLERPNDIPTTHWVKRGQEYTVITMERMQMQGGQIGYELAEIDLLECCFPYTRFSAWRFAVPLSQFTEEYKEQEAPVEEELELAEL